ncbi:MAG TPA: tRNA preQ1(34) S-adenosylmethionine ribosyltransferase-isomerase QueA [bacterium]|nr:tRNA preQ1(34) S-adenosylmethionine ribosyltransferase-isomerase QueA [bacterium]
MSEFLNDYDYVFPPAAVAQEPPAERSASRLLQLGRRSGEIGHRRFVELPELLQTGDLLVANDTAVLASRLYARKPSGGRVEVFLIRPRGDGEWEVFLSPARGLKEGTSLQVLSRSEAEARGPELSIAAVGPEGFRVKFRNGEEERRALSEFGEMPLPPYIARELPRASDRERYQTVFAAAPGAVAAPTAGLHFNEAVLAALARKQIALAQLTLHVGPGTFLPVKTQRVEDHVMHAEFYSIPEATQAAVEDCRKRGGRVIAVGTTSLRALETWALSGKSEGETRLFVRPGFDFRRIDGLLTNFHQPKSTLLMLVSALAGRENILRAYREAIEAGYRLFSYGDCMLIL